MACLMDFSVVLEVTRWSVGGQDSDSGLPLEVFRQDSPHLTVAHFLPSPRLE